MTRSLLGLSLSFSMVISIPALTSFFFSLSHFQSLLRRAASSLRSISVPSLPLSKGVSSASRFLPVGNRPKYTWSGKMLKILQSDLPVD